MRRLRIILLLCISFMLGDVHAKVITQNEFENELHIERAYIVDNYLFDISDGFNPSLKDLLIASSYNSKDNINVYEIKITENINGDIVREYRELLENKTLNSFPNIDIKYIYKGSVSGSAKEVVDNKVLTHNISRAGILVETKYNDLNIERAYILGEYIFNLDNGYNPSLKDLLIAATTVEDDDIKVYEIKRSENISGHIVEEYNELLSFRSLNSYPTVRSHYVYAENINENNYNFLIKQDDVITLNTKEGIYSGTPLIHNNATSISGNAINYEYYDSTDCSGSALNNAPINAGNYSVKASTNDDEYYIGSSKCVTHTIGKKELVITADDKSMSYGNSAPKYSYTATGFVNNETSIILGSSATYEIKAQEGEVVNNLSTANVGTYKIYIKGLTSTNYLLNFKVGTLTINKKEIAFPSCGSKEYTGIEQTLFEAHISGEYTNTVLKGKDANNYVVELIPGRNYKWNSGVNVENARTLMCQITKSNTITTLAEQSFNYTGSEQAPQGASSKLSNSNYTITGGSYTYTYYNGKNCEGTALESIPISVGEYSVIATLAGTSNYNSSLSSCTPYLIINDDTTKPIVSDIEGGTTRMATSQEVKLKCDDNVGVVGYYFGTSKPEHPDDITKTDKLNEITSLDGYWESNIVPDTIKTTYYFACKDSAGNFAYKTIILRRYRVWDLIQKVDATEAYTLGNYDQARFDGKSYTDYIIRNGEELTADQVCNSNRLTNIYNDVTLTSYSFEQPAEIESSVVHYKPNINITINNGDSKYVACWYKRDAKRHIDIRNSVVKQYYSERYFDTLNYSEMYGKIQELTLADGCWDGGTASSSCDKPEDVDYTLFKFSDGTINIYEYDGDNNETKILTIAKENDKYKISNASNTLLIGNIDSESKVKNYIPLLLIPNKTYHFVQNDKNEYVHIDANLRMIKVPVYIENTLKYVRNMRDIGGLVTDSNHDGTSGMINYGKLFRGTAPDLGSSVYDEETNANIKADTKTTFELLGIDVVYDIRDKTDKETGEIYPNYLGYGENNDGHYYLNDGKIGNYSLDVNARTVVEKIMDMVVKNQDVFFHCTAGKDRTGTIAYLLEGILGVSQADMLSDYALSYLRHPSRTNNFVSNSGNSFYSLVQTISSYDGANDEEKFINWFLSFSKSDEEAEQDIQLINDFRAKMISGETPTTYVVNNKKCYVTSTKVYFLNTLTNSVLDSPKDANESVLIVSDGKYILLDTAEDAEDDNIIENEIIYKKLQTLQEVADGEPVTIDYLIVSHSDTDHTGNLKDMLEDEIYENVKKFDIKNVIVKYEAISNTSRKSYEDVYQALHGIILDAANETEELNDENLIYRSRAGLYAHMKGQPATLFTRNGDNIEERPITEGSYIIVGALKMYFYNTNDVYANDAGNVINERDKCGQEGTALSFNSNTKTAGIYKYVQRDENGEELIIGYGEKNNPLKNYKYVYIDGSEYTKALEEGKSFEYHVTDWISSNSKLPTKPNSTGPMDNYFYAIVDKKYNCSANANSIVVLMEVTTAENNRLIYLPSDLENNGYDISPFEDEPGIYGYGTRFMVADLEDVAAGKATEAFGIDENGIFKVLESPKNVRAAAESAVTARIKQDFAGRLQYIDIVQAAHHGLANSYDSVGNLGLNNREKNSFYAIDTTRSTARKTNLFHGALSIQYNLSKASEIAVSDSDDNGIECTISIDTPTTCVYTPNPSQVKHVDIRNSAIQTYYNDRIFDNLDYSSMYDGIQTLTRTDSCWNEETGKSSCDRPADISYTSFNINNGTINVYGYDEIYGKTKVFTIEKVAESRYKISTDSKILVDEIDDVNKVKNYIPLLLIPNKIYQFEQNSKSEIVQVDSNLRMIKIPTDSNKYVRNMRDIGGLATDSNHDGKQGIVQYGILFRGASPDLGSEINNIQAKKAFELLGIDAIYDVRKNPDSSGNVFPNYLGYGENDDGHYYMDNGNVYDYEANYNNKNAKNARNVVKNIMLKVVDNKNVFFHCTAGKDRTGTIAYFIEGILGVSQADMLSDYALSYFKAPDDVNRFSDYQTLVENISNYDGANDEEKFINWFLYFSADGEEDDDIKLINRFREVMISGEKPIVYTANNKKCYKVVD